MVWQILLPAGKAPWSLSQAPAPLPFLIPTGTPAWFPCPHHPFMSTEKKGDRSRLSFPAVQCSELGFELPPMGWP